MKLKVVIRTPPGEARGVEGNLRRIMGAGKKFSSFTSSISPVEDAVAWEVEGDARNVMGLLKNINRFDYVIQQVMGSKKVRKVAKLSEKDLEALNDMLRNHTTIEVIKEATAQEIVDLNKTFWQKLKEKFV